MIELLLEAALRITIPLGAACVAYLALRSRDAVARHTIWSLGILSAVGTVVLLLVLPASWSLEVLPAVESSPADGAIAGEGPRLWTVATVGIWLAGVCLFGGSFFTALVRLRGWVNSATPLPSTHRTTRLIEDLAAPRRVRLRSSPDAPIPFVWGLRRPTIVLPRTALSWSAPDLRAALVHEVGHVRRNDYFLGLVGELLRVAFWFHPLVWVALARLRLEAEMACDALVLADGRSRSAYARQLLAVGTSRDVVAPSLTSSSRLRRRLEQIISGIDAPSLSRSGRLVLASSWLVGTVLVALCAPVAVEAVRPAPTVDVLGSRLPSSTRSGSDGAEPARLGDQPLASRMLPEEREQGPSQGTGGASNPAEQMSQATRTVNRNLSRPVPREVNRTLNRQITRTVNRHVTRTVNRQVTRTVNRQVIRTVPPVHPEAIE